MRAVIPIALTSLLSGTASAADVTLTVGIPRLTVAEYHRPYVAIWLEKRDQSFVGNLAVWYDLKQEGTKWLKDVRQWWRRSGRDLKMPVDGVSSATRPPGDHQVSVSTQTPPFANLPAGEYDLVIEAAREVGGREILRLPFQWPPASPAGLKVQGQHELGAVTLDLKP